MKTRKFTCVRCGAAAERYYFVIRDICASCMEEHQIEANNAGSYARIAAAKGLIAKAIGQSCVDCGKPAKCNDHRDYTKPLEVAPVCPSCNIIRGPGMDSKMRFIPKITCGKRAAAMASLKETA